MKNPGISLLFFIAVLTGGCSQRGWYEGIQKSNELNCYQRPMAQQMECLEEARAISYDQYQRELDKLRGPPQ